MAALCLIAALTAAVQFARGFVGLKHPLFVVSCALSVVLFGIWVLHLVLAEMRASAPRDQHARQSTVPSVPTTSEPRRSLGGKLLLLLTIGLAAYLISQLADRNGGAGHPAAAILVVVGIGASGLLGELIVRNRWRKTTLATLDASMATTVGTYPKAGAHVASTSAGNAGAGAFASAATTIAGALVVALLLNAFSDRSDRLVALAGTWEIGQLATMHQVNMADPASGLGSETWKVAARPGCNEFQCSYNVNPADGPRFVLASTGKYTWTAARIRDADCINADPPYRLVVANGYRASERVKFSVNPGDSTTASIDDNAKYVVNQTGKGHECKSHGSATYAGGATLTRPSGSSSVAAVGSAPASAAPRSGGTTTQQQQTPTKPRSPGLSPRRRAADRSLHSFVEIQFNQPVRCTSTSTPPANSTAQLSCSLNGTGFFVTRLRSSAATDAFLRLRYRQAYPFSGAAGQCSSSGTNLGTWNDGSGRLRGPWGVRQNHGRIEVLWGYDDSSVAFVATGPLANALRVCNVWYDHSG